MVKKIRELLTEAQVSANAAVPGDWSDRTIFVERLHTTFEKFAELLVKECAKYVEDSNLVGIPRDNIPGGMIRYFGVEE